MYKPEHKPMPIPQPRSLTVEDIIQATERRVQILDNEREARRDAYLQQGYEKICLEALPSHVLVADEDSAQLINKLKQTQEMIKNLCKVEDELRDKICGLLGDSDLLLAPNGKELVTWKNYTSQRVNTARLKEEHPSLVEQYTETKETKRFILK
ncbi:hypothetical protein [Candidatus Odyssella acanthamoebae]|uniref:Uncharacterized protein n=1 Tax=Candidatus Odyssella acanthamoebae TaxID=91604 RepID=A0A077AU38_9PROT|nr:hypothetical protein [Candidatus Paracaedibacter acanthamoebae]AIK95896.1 hypothetical protein ID47_02825 [Candidatus Paracaedibacter acanthamoebae]